jgi:hypothetical protein
MDLKGSRAQVLELLFGFEDVERTRATGLYCVSLAEMAGLALVEPKDTRRVCTVLCSEGERTRVEGVLNRRLRTARWLFEYNQCDGPLGTPLEFIPHSAHRTQTCATLNNNNHFV